MIFRFKKKTKGKYKNKKVEYDGFGFDSTKEKDRYVFLKDAEKKGIITDLKRQVKFELIPSIKEKYVKQLKTKEKECERTVQLAISYTCDFQYKKDGAIVVEDVKASPKFIDPTYILKEKIFRWKFGFSIKRVYKANEEI